MPTIPAQAKPIQFSGFTGPCDASSYFGEQPLPVPKRGRGRPAKAITNSFYGHIGPATGYGRYPYFAQDILEGIARLDWHDRPIGSGGSSKPLSVRRLSEILSDVEEVSAQSVMDRFGFGLRQAQRYVKAIEVAMPYLLKARPKHLADIMQYGYVIPSGFSEWTDELDTPSAEVLNKLHHDMRTLGAAAA
ncbi:conserved protein of unknown function [Pseudomonas marincola]|uniref:Uncharacterized protein n=1 Tax=Pseudomonas marincola TaxID=437900 RepID=A0A653DXK8_9PSED|nr:hypothetical protein [Pseudomonas marincola]CAE6931132.1 conserved protein of unknown function [Pseudomonas marincola]